MPGACLGWAVGILTRTCPKTHCGSPFSSLPGLPISFVLRGFLLHTVSHATNVGIWFWNIRLTYHAHKKNKSTCPSSECFSSSRLPAGTLRLSVCDKRSPLSVHSTCYFLFLEDVSASSGFYFYFGGESIHKTVQCLVPTEDCVKEPLSKHSQHHPSVWELTVSQLPTGFAVLAWGSPPCVL